FVAQQAERIAEDVYHSLISNPWIPEGGVDYAKKLIVRSLGSTSAKQMIERLDSSYEYTGGFESIDRLKPLQLSQFIQNEHPQTIALILAQLSPASSAALLSSLPEEIQSDVAVRLANIETISPDIIRGISAVLEEKLKPVGTLARSQSNGGVRSVAQLLN